ncbi:MAG: zinc-ribbon domain-containing protein [Candidatus Aminicenantes bacterium]|nr:zinc-ribbon domain-containing protein [Candidatus Aminicenantes bacterium]
MAITRCPYCHAIIDENVKYCNNCGTQLLFSEDVDVEEEIPGEKIIDADTEEKDYTIEEPEGGSKPKEDPDLDEEIEEETEELALDKLVAEEAGEEDEDLTEEVILVDEIKAAEAGGKGEPEEPEENEETTGLKNVDKEKSEEEEEKDEEEEDEDLEEDEEITKAGEEKEPAEEEAVTPATPALEEPPAVKPEEPPTASEEAEPVIEYLADDKDRDEAEPDEEALPQPVTFDTQELEGIGKTVELGKEKIDKFLEVLAEKEAEVKPPPISVREPTGTLPPWASTMKGAPVFPDETGPVGAFSRGVADTAAPAGEDEVEIFPRRKDSDSTIGLPERVGQSPLPFEPGAAEEEEGEVEEEPDDDEAREKILPTAGPVRTEREAVRPAREAERREAIAEAEVEGEEPAPRPPFSFSIFFKSKAFDVLFVGLFWLVALWLAANSMDATLFDILGSMSGSMLLLYAVFVLIYFFLFKFFLGETLGDRLFRERE